jgi:transposase-like protein
MSDRYYNQMRDLTGWCHGMPEALKHKRRRRMAWTDESKAEAVELYTDANPTPETSMEIVKEIAEQLGESPNGVRMILTKQGVYVKKAPATGSAKSSGGGTARVSKADAAAALTSALTDAGQEVDADIIDKLTGKASVYFTGILNNING